MVEWLGLRASTARGTGSIPGRGTKIPQAVQLGQKKKKKKIVQCHYLSTKPHSLLVEMFNDSMEIVTFYPLKTTKLMSVVVHVYLCI